MSKIKPFKSLWALLLKDWPREVAKFYGKTFRNRDGDLDADMVGFKVLASAGLLILALTSWAFVATFGLTGVAVLALIVAAFDMLRLWGHHLLQEDGEDE